MHARVVGKTSPNAANSPSVDNDFHKTRGIYVLFEDLSVSDIDATVPDTQPAGPEGTEVNGDATAYDTAAAPKAAETAA